MSKPHRKQTNNSRGHPCGGALFKNTDGSLTWVQWFGKEGHVSTDWKYENITQDNEKYERVRAVFDVLAAGGWSVRLRQDEWDEVYGGGYDRD